MTPVPLVPLSPLDTVKYLISPEDQAAPGKAALKCVQGKGFSAWKRAYGANFKIDLQFERAAPLKFSINSRLNLEFKHELC